MSRDDGRGVRPRVLLCSDGGDAAHRTLLGIARELESRRPDTVMLALFDSTAGTSSPPPNLEFVLLPSPERSALFSELRPTPGSRYQLDGLPALREALIYETARVFDPHLIVVANRLMGRDGELARTLASIRGRQPRPPCILGVDDLAAGPRLSRSTGIDAAIDERIAATYDRLLAFASEELYDRRTSNPFSAPVDWCGFIAPPIPSQTSEAVRLSLGCDERPLIVVHAEDDAFLDLYLCALDESGPNLAATYSLVIAGSGVDAHQSSEQRLVSPCLSFAQRAANHIDELAAADAVVVSGNERVALDAIGLGMRVVFIPRQDRDRTGGLQLKKLAELGIATVIEPHLLTPERLGNSVRAALDAQSSPPDVLDFDGTRRAGEILVDTLEQLAPLWPARALRPGPAATWRPIATPIPAPPVDSGDGLLIAQGWEGSRFYVDPNNLIERDILHSGGFENELHKEMALLLLPGDIVLDCGANVGAHACPFARRVGPDGLVVAVEPVPFLADRLEANARLNDLDNLIVVRAAVSSANGARRLFAPSPDSWNQGAGSFYAGLVADGTTIDVETITIDALVESLGVTSARLIKLDVEGHEVDALQGAATVLRTLRPYVVFEYLAENWDKAGRTLREATRLLIGQHGYRVRPVNWRASEDFQMVLAIPPQ